MTYNALTNSLKQNIRVVAFIDDNKSKVGSKNAFSGCDEYHYFTSL